MMGTPPVIADRRATLLTHTCITYKNARSCERLLMSDRSAIEWTEATWNPVTGCNAGLAGMRALLRKALRRALPRRARPSV